MKPLTTQQIELLVIIKDAHQINPTDAAFELMSESPLSAGRSMKALSRRGLTYYDLGSYDSEYVWVITQEGMDWLEANQDKIPKI